MLCLGDPGFTSLLFDLYTDFRRIVRGADNCGVVSWQEGESWQITVYDAGFQTPECIKGKVFYQIFPDRFCEGVENKPMPFPIACIRPISTPSPSGSPTRWAAT